MYVQFSDSTETAVIAVFASPQLAAVENQGAVTASDARWAAFYATLPASAQVVLTTPTTPASPSLAQQAAAAQMTGLTIALSGTLTLSETVFPTDSVTTGKIGTVVTTINATGEFPGGATAYPMKDSAGAWHTFTVSQYKAVAAAIAAYVAALDLIIDGNPLGAATLPVASVSLTV